MRQPQYAASAAPTSLSVVARLIAAGIGIVLLLGVAATAGGVRLAGRPSPLPVASPLSMDAGRDLDGPGLRSRLIAEGSAVPRLTAPSPAPATRAHPATSAMARPHVTTAKRRPVVRRWLPTGTGMWLHQWDRSNGGNPRAVVKRAQQNGITTLFVRGWSKRDGYEAPRALRALLPATKGTNIKVVVWEFVYLNNPVAEARRLAAEAKIGVNGAPRVAAVAPDIETAAEGTAINSRRVLLYMKTLRAALPRNVSILVTVPWPSEHRVGKFPYAAAARYANAILPMAYWYNRSPVAVTAASVRFLRRYHRPIMPVGQGYDGRLDAPWLPPANISKQVGAFLVTARQAKVPAVSLWSWQTAPTSVWRKLSQARSVYGG